MLASAFYINRSRQKRSLCSFGVEKGTGEKPGFGKEKGTQSSSLFQPFTVSLVRGQKGADVPTSLWRQTFNILISHLPGLGQTRRAVRFLDPDVASYNRLLRPLHLPRHLLIHFLLSSTVHYGR